MTALKGEPMKAVLVEAVAMLRRRFPEGPSDWEDGWLSAAARIERDADELIRRALTREATS